MKIPHLVLLALAIAFLPEAAMNGRLFAQDTEDAVVVPATQSPLVPGLEDRPWPQKLGIRSAFFARQWPLVDTVVLVPDLPTWLDEIMKWNLRDGRWPVLIEDDYFTRLFVRRFAPSTIIRRPSIGSDLPEDPVALEALVRRNRITAWGGADAFASGQSMNDLYRKGNWAPPGIVATSFSDPAWPAAVTLAIAHGQLLRTLDIEFSDIGGAVDSSNTGLLKSKIDSMFDESGWTWGRFGDQLQTLTLCRAFPVRARVVLPDSARMRLPDGAGGGTRAPDPPVAITDLLCRDGQYQRYAVCGWIFGDHVRSIYMAMCSVFIDRSSVSLFSAYESRDGADGYRVTVAGKELERAGFEVTTKSIDHNASLEGWRRLAQGGFDSDVLFMNTSGRSTQMELAEKTTGRPSDLPALTRPLALQLIHSFSLQLPSSPWTLGGRWLDRGVYAYVGSCNEPFLTAFRAPLQVVEWITNYAPFLVAARQYQGEMSKPWRVVTIGDPLMLIERPGVSPIARVSQGRSLAEGELDVRRSLLERLRSQDPVDASILRDLILLNQDKLAASLWDRDLDSSGSPEAEAVLPLLYERRQFSKLLQAYRMLDKPSEYSKDLLWASYLPRLDDLDSLLDLELLQDGLRENLMSDDLDALMPHITRLKGAQAARASIRAALELATTERDRKRLRNRLQSDN